MTVDFEQLIAFQRLCPREKDPAFLITVEPCSYLCLLKSTMESKIKVGVRIRPLNSKELEASSPSVVGSEASKFVITKPPAKKTSFEYDWSFNQASSNRDVYEKSCRPLIENIFDGFNATFFACK